MLFPNETFRSSPSSSLAWTTINNCLTRCGCHVLRYQVYSIERHESVGRKINEKLCLLASKQSTVRYFRGAPFFLVKIWVLMPPGCVSDEDEKMEMGVEYLRRWWTESHGKHHCRFCTRKHWKNSPSISRWGFFQKHRPISWQFPSSCCWPKDSPRRGRGEMNQNISLTYIFRWNMDAKKVVWKLAQTDRAQFLQRNASFHLIRHRFNIVDSQIWRKLVELNELNYQWSSRPALAFYCAC